MASENEFAKDICEETIKQDNILEELKYSRDEFLSKAKNIKLKRNESIYLATVLEDAINQLLILGACNQELKSMSAKNENSLRQTITSLEDQLETIDLFELAKDSHKIAKMNSDKKYVTELLIKTFLDLKINGTYVSLSVHLIDVAAKAYQSIVQKFKYNENRRKIKKLQSDLKSEEKINQITLANCDLEIDKLKDEINDAASNCEIKKKYVETYQNSRKEQHELKLKMEESEKTTALVKIKEKIQQEIEVNEEIDKFIRLVTSNLSKRVDLCVERYNTEKRQLSEEIDNMEQTRESQKEKKEALEILVRKRQVEMDDWKALVQERKLRQEEEELLQRSAIRLQSWWRGIMVRRRLAAKKKKAKDAKRKSAKRKK